MSESIQTEPPKQPAPAGAPFGLDPEDYRDLRGTGALGIAWAVVPGILGGTLLWNLGAASDWLDAQGDTGRVLYVLVFSITAGLGLLPTYAQATLGGWLYGFAFGFPAALLGFTLASAVGYGVARLVAGDRVQQVLDRHPQAELIRRELVGQVSWRALFVITLLRVPPNSPFSLTNLALAAARVNVPIFLVGTLFGMAPRTAAYIGFAAAARSSGAEDIQSFVSDGPGWIVFVVGIVSLLAVFAILGKMAESVLARYGASVEAPAE
ncbi:MAG: VTT domain-containing protein [Planctomycetota bacterium]